MTTQTRQTPRVSLVGNRFRNRRRIASAGSDQGQPFVVCGEPAVRTYVLLHAARDGNVSRAEAEQQPGYLSFEKLGYHIARADLKLRAEKAERPIARALETESHDAILVLQRTTYSGKGEPLEHTTCYLRSDTIEFVLEAHGALQLSATVQQISAGEDVAAKRPVKRGRSGLRA